MIYSISGLTINNAYDALSDEVESAYDKQGNKVYSQEKHWDYSNYSISDMFTYSSSNLQSFSIYGNKIAQVREGYSLYIIDMTTHSKIREVSMDMGHGNSCQFGVTFYSDLDEFPLFYIRNDGIWVYRILGTTSILLRKYTFSADILGTYVASFGVDDVNRRIYTASYTEGSYETKTGQMRICSWDMDDATDLGSNTYSLRLLDTNDFSWFDRFDAVQGSCYHDGYFFISCGLNNTGEYVVMVDVNTLEIANVITITGTQEIEGCAWYNDEYLVTGQNPSGITYKKVQFGTI